MRRQCRFVFFFFLGVCLFALAVRSQIPDEEPLPGPDSHDLGEKVLLPTRAWYRGYDTQQLCNLGLSDKQKHRLVAFPENTLRRSRVAAEVVPSPRESRE